MNDYQYTVTFDRVFVGGVLEGLNYSTDYVRFVSYELAEQYATWLLNGQHNSATSTWVAKNVKINGVDQK